MKARRAIIERKTRETDIRIGLNLDGAGRCRVTTGIGFMDHMLELLGRHALVDLEVRARGDIHVDYHHTVEDLGIVLGQCLNRALGDRKGIARYGWCLLPMDESLCQCAVDLGGRPYLVYRAAIRKRRVLDFDIKLVEEFMRALVTEARMNLQSFDPATGENLFYGEYLINAQGEDVVAGIRTPQKIATLQQAMPKVYDQLMGIRQTLEKHYRDMQDIEFTIQEGTLYMLQTRVGKRNGTAAILRDDASVFTLSLHGAKNFPFRKEASDLDVDLPALLLRVHDFRTRGLAKRPDQDFTDLFHERLTLYTRYADLTIKCSGLTQEEVCMKIIDRMRGKS